MSELRAKRARLPRTMVGLKILALGIDKELVTLLTIGIIMSPFAIVGCLKGRYALSIVGVFVLLGIPAILAATRLGRADSWWARRFYDEAKLIQTGHRYPGNSRINDAFTL